MSEIFTLSFLEEGQEVGEEELYKRFGKVSIDILLNLGYVEKSENMYYRITKDGRAYLQSIRRILKEERKNGDDILELF